MAPVGPEICRWDPPKTAARKPATIAVMSPCSAVRPELTPNPSAKGRATMPTVAPARRSFGQERRVSR